jgi:hypothetical protein
MKIAQIRTCFVDERKTVSAIGWRKLRWYDKCIHDVMKKWAKYVKNSHQKGPIGGQNGKGGLILELILGN